MMRRWLACLSLVLWLLVGACQSSGLGKSPATPQPDRIVGVAVVCTYVFREPGTESRAMTQDGSGEFCQPDTPFFVGTRAIIVVENRRAVVTVRTPAGGSYTVETPDTTVKVGDPWPPGR